MLKFKFVAITVFAAALSGGPALAQTAPAQAPQIDEDVVIALGQKSPAGMKAMQAFNAGDYETAEIEFQRHYDALTRTERAVRRAGRIGADAGFTRDVIAGPGEIGVSGGGSAGQSTPNAVFGKAATASAANAAGQSDILQNRSGKTRTTRYEDLAFADYMTALSQIQLGKLDAAKTSLRKSVEANYRNYDAQMRLGLLELRDGDALNARERLIRLDKMRKSCRGCADEAGIRKASLTLAKALTDAAN